MTISTAAGSKIYIGTTADAENISEFLADSYIEVGEVEDLGEFGDEAEQITFSALADGRVKKFKGTRDAGTIAVVCGADGTDDGQDAMVAAEASILDYNFKVVLNDQVTLGGDPSEHYFRGKVMSKRLNVGSVNNVVRQTFNVGINTAILVVEAT